MRSQRSLVRTLVVPAVAVAGLLAAACGGESDGDVLGQLGAVADDDGSDERDQRDDDGSAERAADDDGGASAGSADLLDDIDLSSLTADVPDATVYQRGFELTVTDLDLVDLDRQAVEETGVELTSRVRGFELVADVEVFNATSSAGSPAQTSVSLRWEEPGTGNVVSLRGRLDVREVPSQAQTSGELVVPIGPDDAEVFDTDSAALLFGEEGRSAAVLPLGGDAELVTRLPVEQTSLVDVSFDVGDTLVTITGAWIHPDTAADGPLPDDEVLLELTYDLEQRSDIQTCSSRSRGSWSLTTPDGVGYTDLGVSERCVREVPVSDVLTGFRIDADYAGPYTLVHERSGQGQDFEGEISITLEDLEGIPSRDR